MSRGEGIPDRESKQVSETGKKRGDPRGWEIVNEKGDFREGGSMKERRKVERDKNKKKSPDR